MTAEKVINGVNVQKLRETMQELRKDKSLAGVVHRAHNAWVNGAHVKTRFHDFSIGGQEATHARPLELEADEPAALLGEDIGPSATEALLHALASCLNASFIYQAALRHVRIEKLELELEGDLDLRGFLGLAQEVRNGYQRIRVTFRVKSEAPESVIKDLLQQAQNRSPVFDMVSHGVPVTASLKRW